MSIIQFDKIDLSFGQKKVFSNFSLRVAEKEKVLISGKSGLGKSSLFALIMGFIAPQNGTVYFKENPITEKTAWNIRKQIAYIDQDVSVPQKSSQEWLYFVSRLKANHALDFSKETFHYILQSLELPEEVLTKNTTELSGGERQRLAILTALLLKREVFLLDEVTSSLDIHLKEKVAEIFAKNSDWTVLIISHDETWLKHSQIKIFDLGEKKWRR